MTVRIEAAPWPNSRITGVVYLLYFLTAIFAVVLVRGLVVSDDAAATAHSILAHEPLFRGAYAIGLIGTALYVVVTALFYGLFKPANKMLALVADRDGRKCVALAGADRNRTRRLSSRRQSDLVKV